MQLNSAVGGYKIIELIGEGSIATVFRGLDVLLEREVALKLFRPELAHNPQFVKRFRAEAVALARLDHPNIVKLYQLFCDIEHCFMVLEFVRGETLDSFIRRCGPIPWQTALPLICQALDGLEHAHNLNVIHHDIKPSSLILTESQGIKIMDFRVASMLEDSDPAQLAHTPDMLKYMAPEQIQGQHTDYRADIYSIGMVLYELLTAPAEGTIKSLRASAPTIPLRLEAIVLHALEKSPGNRFQSAAEFRRELADTLKAASAGQEAEDSEERSTNVGLRPADVLAESPTSQGNGKPLKAGLRPGSNKADVSDGPAESLSFRTSFTDILEKISAKHPWLRNRRAAVVTLLLLPVFLHALYLMFSALGPQGKETVTSPVSVVESSPAVHSQNNVSPAEIASPSSTEAVLPLTAGSVSQEPAFTPKDAKPLENPPAVDGRTAQAAPPVDADITQTMHPEETSSAGNIPETVKNKGNPKSVNRRPSQQSRKVDGGWTITTD
ncbi:MAG: serine/threonine protein kinase [Methylomonas sp.]